MRQRILPVFVFLLAALLLPQTGDRQLLDAAEQILAQGGVLPENGHTALLCPPVRR